MRLIALDLSNRGQVLDLVSFVNEHYSAAAVPLTETAVLSGRTRFFWAHDGEKRVGVSAYIERTPALAETVKTVIAPECRGQGYGEQVSQAIEDECRRAGFKKVLTTVYIDNYAMILIKLKQGYRFEGFHPDHERPGWHEYSFGKVLT
jgi:GNAT superfamily N-acetyltransferase